MIKFQPLPMGNGAAESSVLLYMLALPLGCHRRDGCLFIILVLHTEPKTLTDTTNGMRKSFPCFTKTRVLSIKSTWLSLT